MTAKRLRSGALVVVLLWGSSPGSAQQPRIVYGIVTSHEAGVPVSGAQVRLSADGYSAMTTTDAEGRFRFIGVAPSATYSISAAGPGQAWGSLGRVYSGYPTRVYIRLYHGPAEGPCGEFRANREVPPGTYLFPDGPVEFERICL